jgi:hypothetical protein
VDAIRQLDDPPHGDVTSKFGVLCDYQLYPVVDIADAVRAGQEGGEFRESIS